MKADLLHTAADTALIHMSGDGELGRLLLLCHTNEALQALIEKSTQT